MAIGSRKDTNLAIPPFFYGWRSFPRFRPTHQQGGCRRDQLGTPPSSISIWLGLPLLRESTLRHRVTRGFGFPLARPRIRFIRSPTTLYAWGRAWPRHRRWKPRTSASRAVPVFSERVFGAGGLGTLIFDLNLPPPCLLMVRGQPLCDGGWGDLLVSITARA